MALRISSYAGVSVFGGVTGVVGCGILMWYNWSVTFELEIHQMSLIPF
jgi:hypothetical protein